MTNRELIAHVDIIVDGSSLEEKHIDRLREVSVDTSLYLPGMFEIVFDDEDLSMTDGSTFDLGKSVEIKMQPDDSETYGSVIKGEITAIEPHFEAGKQVTLVIRGYDKSHRLNRGTVTKVFQNMSDSDIVSQIASGASLTGSVDATTPIRDSVFQQGITNLEFLHYLAKRNGCKVWVDGTTLNFKKSTHTSSTVTLDWDEDILEFSPRLSVSRQVEEVTVRGWDVTKKEAIVGKATSSSTQPEISVGGWGGAVAKSKITSAKYIEVTRPVISQAEADKIAQGILDSINGSFVEAEGVARGNTSVVAGVKVNIKNLGSKFSGKYAVTSATHHYNEGIYEVYFRVEGATRQTLSDYVNGGGGSSTSNSQQQLWYGITTAIVTDNNDPDKLGRVKLKYPWLDDSLQSFWTRVMTIGAGVQAGLQWTPSVNDEVIVAFQHGDFDYPLVIGSVWNGTDKPILDPPTEGGKPLNVQLKTVKGHKLDFDEKNEVITLVDSQGKTLLKFDAKNELITIECSKDIMMKAGGKFDIDATGDVTIKSGANVKIESSQNMELKVGGNLTEKATGNVEIKATGNITVKATGMGNFECTGMGTVKSAAILTVKGSIVNIN